MKKNVKTLFALVLTLAMVLSTNLVLPAQAAETVDSNLTYELDFSGLQATGATGNKGLKSKVSSVWSSHYVHSTDDLTVGTYNGVEALELGPNTGIRVQSDGVGTNDLTFEMWVYKKSDSVSKGSMFTYYRSVDGSKKDELQMYFTNSNTMSFMPYYASSGEAGDPGNTRDTYTFSDNHYVDDWEHITVTRTYNDAGTTATTKLYSNGVLKEEYTKTDLLPYVASNQFVIGEYASSNDTDLAIGAFRVYNKVLSQSEIQGKYDAEKAAYGVAARDERMTYELDFSGLQATGATGDKGLKSTKSVSASHYVHSTNDLTIGTYNGVQALELGTEMTGIRVQTDAILTKDLSVEMWVYKKNDSVSKGSLFTVRRTKDAGKADEMQMYFTNGNTMSVMPYYAANGTAGDPGNTREAYTYSDYHYTDDWEHIIMTRTYDEAGTTATTKLYSNGNKIKEWTKTDILEFNASNEMWIGEYASKNDTDVAIGAFRTYNAVLSDSDVKEKYDLEKEKYGAADRDILTYDLDFSNYNPTTNPTFENATPTRGVTINQHYSTDMSKITVEEIEGVEALKFDDAEGFLVDSTDGSAFGSKDLTIEMWAYKYDGASKGSLFKLVREKTSTAEMEMYFNNKDFDVNGSLVLNYGRYTTEENGETKELAASQNVVYNDKFEKDAWQHIVFSRTVDTDTAVATTNVYVNGQSVYTVTTNDATFVTPYRLFIGDYNSGTTLNAALAELKVYNVELDADEIKAKFLEAAPNYNNVTYYSNDAEVDELTTDMTAVKSSVWVLNTEDKAVDMMAFAAVYQDNVLVKTVPVTQEVAANDVWNFDIDITDITVDANTKIKTFVWAEDGLKPLYVADDQVIQCL